MSRTKKLVAGLLAAGAFLGFAAGFARLGHRAAHQRHHFEQRVAELCADAALRARGR